MVGGEQSYFQEISLDHATLAQLPERSELAGLSAVTLSDDGSGTEPVLEESEEHDSEPMSSSFVPAAPRHATVEQVVSVQQA